MKALLAGVLLGILATMLALGLDRGIALAIDRATHDLWRTVKVRLAMHPHDRGRGQSAKASDPPAKNKALKKQAESMTGDPSAQRANTGGGKQATVIAPEPQATGAGADPQNSAPQTSPTERRAAKLISMINDLRAKHELPPIPTSRALNEVAVAHVKDLNANPPSGVCNSHSWSVSSGLAPCCYTPDHAVARCMWDKPREITRGKYLGDGFEIAVRSTEILTPEIALKSWQGSAQHINVVLNRDRWLNVRWQAIGAAIDGRYAVVWFGKIAE